MCAGFFLAFPRWNIGKPLRGPVSGTDISARGPVSFQTRKCQRRPTNRRAHKTSDGACRVRLSSSGRTPNYFAVAMKADTGQPTAIASAIESPGNAVGRRGPFPEGRHSSRPQTCCPSGEGPSGSAGRHSRRPGSDAKGSASDPAQSSDRLGNWSGQLGQSQSRREPIIHMIILRLEVLWNMGRRVQEQHRSSLKRDGSWLISP